MSEKRRINRCIRTQTALCLYFWLGKSLTKLLLLIPEVIAHLPAAGVLPVQVQAVKVVLLNERNHILDEPGPGGRAVDQSAVLVPLAVIPTPESQGDLHRLHNVGFS